MAEFHTDEAKLAKALAHAQRGPHATAIDADKKLASAYTMGRFADRTPVVEQAVDGWVSQPNNLNFDPGGVRCPFHAHIRKVNARGDKVRQFTLSSNEDRARRIVRRGVSFGPRTLDPGPEPVGLLFICAQSNIAEQFDSIKTIWSNLTDFLRPTTGPDSIIGQAAPTAPDLSQQWQYSPYFPYQFGKWVDMRGGEYFFLPSLSFLTGTTT